MDIQEMLSKAVKDAAEQLCEPIPAATEANLLTLVDELHEEEIRLPKSVKAALEALGH